MIQKVEIEFTSHMHHALDQTLDQLGQQPFALVIIAACPSDEGTIRLSLGGWGDRPDNLADFLRLVAANVDLSPDNIIESRAH